MADMVRYDPNRNIDSRMCLACGVYVGDVRVHDRFHAQLARVRAAEAAAETVHGSPGCDPDCHPTTPH